MTHSRHLLNVLVHRRAVQSNACTKLIFKDSRPTSHNHLSNKDTFSVYEIQITGEINMCKQGKRLHPMARNHLKS